MYEYQYLIGGSLSLVVALYVITRKPRTFALKSLSLFGLATFVWEFAVFFSKTAPDAITAANLYLIVILTSHLALALYLLTILNIQEKRTLKTNTLILVPAMMQAVVLPMGYFNSYMFSYREDSWSYSIVNYQLPLIFVSVIFVGYLISIVIVLFDLIRRTNSTLLKRKYAILLVSFLVFQAIGTIATNALIAFSTISSGFRLGGVLQLLTFVFIWYAMTLKTTRIRIFAFGQDFSQTYSSFLTNFYNSKIDSQLGEGFFEFEDFIAESGIPDNVSVNKDKIAFRDSDTLNIAELIKRNLDYFDRKSTDPRVVDSYLRVLKAAQERLDARFDEVIKANEDFLKKSDLIYGISNGRYLKEATADTSSKGLEAWDACLKIYKRILYPIIERIHDNPQFQNKLSEHELTGLVRVSDYGEISTLRAREWLPTNAKDREITFVIQRFNSFLVWVYEELLRLPDTDVEEILEELNTVLRLNKEEAVTLGVYPSLLGVLATRIPRTNVHVLYSDYLEELVEERTRALKEAQESLLKSQRLATIGEAAAMVGHDLRNPLQAIVNMLYIAEKKLAADSYEDMIELIRTIGEQVGYMDKIVSDLQDYARPIRMNLSEVDIEELLRQTFSSIGVPEKVRVSFDIQKELPSLLVDPLLMKRAFTNFALNAIQAMPEGGKLIISASADEKSALISIQDTGVGISEKNLEKLYQPFFTTKPRGQGLGLSVCKRLIEAHNGSISVESKVGVGTTFRIRIPLTALAKPAII